MKKCIAIVVGTRPEAIKLIPVYLSMLSSNTLKPILISTGQHKEMLNQIFGIFKVKSDIELSVMQIDQSLSDLTARIMSRLDIILDELGPDALIVQGDTTTAFVAGLTAFYHKIPVGHVEAGLRTYDNYSPFPEEVNRKLIGSFATWNFAPTKKAVDALEKENVGNIYCVGNTVIDSLLFIHRMVMDNLAQYESYFSEIIDSSRKIVLVTAHRRESFGGPFENICSAIRTLAKRYPNRLFVYPVHLNPAVQEVVHRNLSGISNIRLIEPLPYDRLIYLMSISEIILSDSGGIQEEGPTFGCPIVVMRDVTEREEGIRAGCAILGGTTERGIVDAVCAILDDEATYNKMAKSRNPYGDGTSAIQIATILEESPLLQ